MSKVMPAKKLHRPCLQTAFDRLAGDGLIQNGEYGLETSKRWQLAMMRAAAEMMNKGDEGDDIRVPIAHALLSIYGETRTNDELSELLLAMMEVESQWMYRIQRQQSGKSHH